MEFKTGGLADIGGIGESWAGKPTVAVTQISSIVSSIAGMFEANRHAYDIHLKTKFQVPANCAVWVQKVSGPDWNSTRLILHWFSEVLDGGSKVLRLAEYALLRDLGFIESIDRLRAALFIAGMHYQSNKGVDPGLLSEADAAFLSQRLKHWKEDLVDGVIDLNDRLKLARLKLESEYTKKPDGAGSENELKATGTAGDGKRKSTRKVNAKGSQTAKLVSYLASHHDYENGRVGNYHPAESADIAKESKAKPSTVSDFLKREFPWTGSPRTGYVQACTNKAKLLHWFMVQFKDNLPARTGNIDAYNEADIREEF